MPYCSKCGADAAGSFCPSCGAPVANQSAGGSGYAPPPHQQTAAAQTGGLSENVAGALAYLFGVFTGILFLALEPYNKMPVVRFHAWQSIFLSAAWIVFWVVLGILTSAMSFLALVLVPVELLIALGVFCYWLLLMFKAYNGQMLVIPIIGEQAKKQAGL